MLRRVIFPCSVVLVAVIALACFSWQATQAETDSSKKAAAPNISELTETLGGKDRYLTHLSTDKPMYRKGEKLYLRGVLLHQGSRKPLPTNAQANAYVEIQGPKGDTVAGGWAKSKDSVLGFSWKVPENMAGGEYVARVTYPGDGYTPAERKFDIRAYRAPRLKSQIKFLRDGYGPGDQVAATLHTERAEGGIPAGAKVTVVARVDGAETYRGTTTVDAKGNCATKFSLPDEIARGEGTLAMVVADGGVLETASKTIPILLQTVDLQMYPEGGQLVAGFPNRVYVEAFTPAKKPADLAGAVVDSNGKEVARFRTEHEGRGRFRFQPKEGENYTLKINEPAGIHSTYPLPEVQNQGAILTAEKDVFEADEPIQMNVKIAPADRRFKVTLAKREQVVATARPGSSVAKFRLSADDPDGILIATVWDSEDKPLAERLIFRRPSHSVNVRISADAKKYTPGGKAKLTIRTSDEAGKPISAVVGVTVTDDSVLEMIEKREQAPRLPLMVLFENDVKELADAHVYLDPANPKADLAVDLLLGTQGWRRFAFVDTAQFIKEHGDGARRALALRMVTRRDLSSLFKRREDRFFGNNAAIREKAEIKKAAKVNKLKDALPVPAAAPARAGVKAEEPQAQLQEKPAAALPKPAADAIPAGAVPFVPEGAEKKQRADLRKALELADEQADLKRLVAGRRNRRPVRNDMVAVRIYAHQVRGNRQPGQRVDFTETLFWHAGLKTDEKGEATIEFGLNDSVTSFRVFADAFDSRGGVGSSSLQIDSVEPFYVEPKLPLEVTSGDWIQIPIAVVNSTNADISGTRFVVTADQQVQPHEVAQTFALPADARIRRLLELRVGDGNGPAQFTLNATAGPYADKVTRSVVVQPRGFPIEVGFGGLITPGDTVSQNVSVPDDLVPGSLSGKVLVYPTPLASMTQALERLIREPYGCFEQTSSTTYPLVMAQQYFMSHQGVDPSLIDRSAAILDKGYNRLLGFECKGGGFEWFGHDPGHDALTAYGLMEFTDMSQVRHVDPKMRERTRQWLLDQRNGKGGFARKTHTLHTWLADPEIANAYNTWGLLVAGVKADLSTEVEWIRDAAERTENTYVIALAANVMSLAGEKEGEEHLLDKLAGKQSDDGSLAGATRSVVGSGGQALVIETTSLAVLAWLRNPHYQANVEKSIKYLAESCKAGRFGSTQSTVLALRAIVAYDQSRATPKSPGSLQLIVDGKAVGEPVEFDKDTQGAIEMPAFAELLAPGKHQVQVKMAGGSRMPYSVAVDFHRLKPDSAEACKLHMNVELTDKKVNEGEVTEAEVAIINRSNEDVPTPTAIIGIPGGLEVRHDQLKELVKAEKIAAYEVRGREVVLYWRVLQAEERVDLPISLVAAIPGSYTGPASRAYLYYTDEHKHWDDGLSVEILPKSK